MIAPGVANSVAADKPALLAGGTFASVENKFIRPGRRGDRGGLETFFHKIVMIRNNLRVLAPGSVRASMARRSLGERGACHVRCPRHRELFFLR
jgi:hypothetical protein